MHLPKNNLIMRLDFFMCLMENRIKISVHELVIQFLCYLGFLLIMSIVLMVLLQCYFKMYFAVNKWNILSSWIQLTLFAHVLLQSLFCSDVTTHLIAQNLKVDQKWWLFCLVGLGVFWFCFWSVGFSSTEWNMCQP